MTPAVTQARDRVGSDQDGDNGHDEKRLNSRCVWIWNVKEKGGFGMTLSPKPQFLSHLKFSSFF